MRRLTALAAATFVLVAACSTGGGARRQVTVFAAASLGDAFKAMVKPFAAAHDNYSLTFSFAGSQQLVTQLQQGAKADALATADQTTMGNAPKKDLVSTPVVFARNHLVIAVGRGNPKHVHTLADLARPDLKVVLAASAVPAGKYANQALAKAGVNLKPVSLEDNVEGVVTKVGLGEADAGIVYVTDATASRNVDAVPIADADNVVAEYPVVALNTGSQRAGGRQFVAFLRSPAGQSILRRFGFLPPT
jgi:molybdate transport system substrate-binding protein